MDEEKDMIMIRPRELMRLQIIQKIFGKQINQQEAAETLKLSDRQIRRIVKRVREEGEIGIVHRWRGKTGRHCINDKKKQKIIKIYRKTYTGFGPTLASEKMEEREGLKVNDETLRLWLIEEGLWKVKRHRKEKKRSWRARKKHVGEMVQLDGSHHGWLEDRGPKLVLMGYVDDADGDLYAEFHKYEGTEPAMSSLNGYIKKKGIPRSIYLDKHSTYKNNQKQKYKDWPFRDQEELTQFSRACKQLGIELIYANSPQAKGRVERMFETLQDRLVKEMRLEGIKTLKEANAFLKSYLPVFNKKFNVVARESGNLHTSARGLDLKEILSIQKEHVLRNDRTVKHENKLYQILNRTRARKVVVCRYLDGRIEIKNGKKRFQYKIIEERPKRVVPRKVKPRIRYIPPANSPWRRFKINEKPVKRKETAFI